MILAQLIDAFLRERRLAGCRASTLRTYTSRLASLRRRLGGRDVRQLTRSELLDWLADQRVGGHRAESGGHRANQRINESTNQRRAAATVALSTTLLRMLQAFALDEELIGAPWLKPKDLKKPKARRRERTATPEETARLLAAMTPNFRRLYEAYRFTGARRSELCQARIEDLVGQSPQRAIVLKDHKTSEADGRDRVIHLGPEADQLVSQAIGGRTFGRIFLDDAGRPWKPDRVSRIFRRLRRRLGLHEDLVIHSTRHEFATAIVATHGLKKAQALLGHANLHTTERYAHLAAEDLREALSDLYRKR